ncbi:MAG: GIY-YIG nuclease family protein, partial [Patescibacteria group bacterium]|nr:GIY-YIG nuclease family protein [Patescibacteria group bacterium]
MQRDDLKKFKLPDTSGVYCFRKGRKILYIGKAASLRDRVRSYFASDLVRGRGEAIRGMVEKADRITWQETDSVLEALILEANLIKKHQPPYNVDEKDNKSFNYLVITKEEYPRVLVVRGRELFQKWEKKDIKYLFGPFPHGGALQEALRIVRRIFPFRDSKCIPCKDQRTLTDKKTSKKIKVGPLSSNIQKCKSCFSRQVGLCPGVCTGEVSAREYAKTIRNIKDLFSGNFHGLKRRLAREMKACAAEERYEEARERRRQVAALEHIRDVSLIKDELRVAPGGHVFSSSGARVEAYDVAHTSGHETVAVMTVVEGGEALKSAYRKFKIRSATNDDIAALKEALGRRLEHPEWPLPRVFVVDGGKAQVNAAVRILRAAGLSIPVVGVIKNEFHKPERLTGDKRALQSMERDILLANHEAHRFAIGWH